MKYTKIVIITFKGSCVFSSNVEHKQIMSRFSLFYDYKVPVIVNSSTSASKTICHTKS